MANAWQPAIGDHVLVTLGGDDHPGRYVIRGKSGERLLLHDVWYDAGVLREGTRRREVRWSDVRDLRPAPPQDH